MFIVAIVVIAVTPSVSVAYYQYANTGYQYTDYNAGPVNYYNHQSATYNPYAYVKYYPQYYYVYYTQPRISVCNEPSYVASYYEEWNRSPNCSDRLEDWNNRQGLPNYFLSSMYGASRY